MFTTKDNDVIVARAKWPATGDGQTDGKQSHTWRLGEKEVVVGVDVVVEGRVWWHTKLRS